MITPYFQSQLFLITNRTRRIKYTLSENLGFTAYDHANNQNDYNRYYYGYGVVFLDMIIVAFIEALVWLTEGTVVAAIYHAELPVVWCFVQGLIYAGLVLGGREPSLANVSGAIEECEVFWVIFRFDEAEIAIFCLENF